MSLRTSLLVLLAACTSSGESTSTASDVTALRVEPAELTLTTRPGSPATADFLAYATFDDGTEAPYDLVSWTTSNASAGGIDSQGHFRSTDTNGGTTTIAASHLDLSATCDLTVVYTDRVLDGVDDVVADAFEAASPADDPTLALSYPADGVTVPRNIQGFAFAWDDPGGLVWRIHFQSAITDISVYATGSPWTADSTLWEIIAAANREGEVSVQLSAGRWDGVALSDVRAGPTMTLRVHRLDARGSVLYWQTTTKAVMRVPFGETTATRFYPPADDDHCYGCHVIAESTQQMVVTHDGVNGAFSVLDVANPDALTLLQGPVDGHHADFKTLSPDGQTMVAVENGVATVYHLPEGTPLTRLATGSDHVTQPEWSPDGRTLLLVHVTGAYMSDMQFTGGEIVSYPFDGTTLGTPTILAARGEWNNYYPAYSPDGRWIAFNRSKGDAYANADAELWLIRPDGTGAVRLDAANGTGALRNSYPRWAPLPDDHVLWLAYSSSRRYTPAGLADTPQIWVSAVDEDLAETGADPSAPPFWMPGQDPSSNNHLPYWWSQ